MASSEHSVGFEPADRLAQDRDSVRRRFWIKLKQVVAKLPFAEDLLAAYYCAFDRETPRHVQAALLGAIAYFVLPFDFVPDMLPILGFTDDAAVLATAIRMVASHITPEHREAARAALKRGVEHADDRIARQRLALRFCRRAGAGTWARAFFSASHAWNCLNRASRSPSVCALAAVAGLCFRKSSNLARVTASMLCDFSHCSAEGRRCQSCSGADSETSFHFGWNGGFWNVGNFVKNASTNCDELAIAVGVGRPVIGGEHRGHRDGVDLLAFRDQVRIVLRRQLAGR